MRINKNGVSLLVLSVAIVIMAILATSAIMTLEETNIISDSKSSVKAHNKESVEERLDVLKNTLITDSFGSVTVNDFADFLIDEGEVVETPIENADGSISIKTVSDYVATVIQDGESNLIIDVEGAYKTDKPEFDMAKLTADETSITVDVILRKGVYVEYTYSYKLAGATDYTTVNTVPTKVRKQKITGLAVGNTYNVKITATNPYGTTSVVYDITTK